jgi:hypothetical protein
MRWDISLRVAALNRLFTFPAGALAAFAARGAPTIVTNSSKAALALWW